MLRKGIAYIPQLPFLLQGTIRMNLDPFNEIKGDAKIKKVLEEVNLWDHINKMTKKLGTEVGDNNNLFSVG